MTRIDWNAYYQQFCDRHGKNPIIYQNDEETGLGGYLLFPDGWMYSRSDKSGPEYPPLSEQDALHKIKEYWRIRHSTFLFELRSLRQDIEQLVREQQGRSAPLQTLTTVAAENDEGKRVQRTESGVVDFRLLLDRCKDLKEEVEHCKEMYRNAKIPDAAPEGSFDFSPAGILAEMEETDG